MHYPERLDDYIAEDNPVRVVDVFVDELDLKSLGFDGINAEVTGRPAYHPATLLKIYIYGNLNRIQSSRRLERFTDRKLKARMQQLEDSIARYLIELDRADREPTLVNEARVGHIKGKIATVEAQMRQLKQIGQQMSKASDGQIDARPVNEPSETLYRGNDG